jgi:hypothetical protein
MTGADDGLGVADVLGDSDGVGLGVGTTALGEDGGAIGTIRAVDEMFDKAILPATIAAMTTAASPEVAARRTRCRRLAVCMTRS